MAAQHHMEPREGTTGPADDQRADTDSLVSLLGDQRATIVQRLKAAGEQTVAELADHLGISEVATRRHVATLEDGGYVTSRTVKQDRGRPAASYRLTDRARRLFPHRYATVAGELLDFLSAEHGREGVRGFLNWRLGREADALGEIVTAEDLHDRLDQLAGALSEKGYDASVEPSGEAFVLRQEHCAIYDVAKEHPEMCTYEAATFSRVLGRDVSLSRRETLAGGHDACICTVTPRKQPPTDPK